MSREGLYKLHFDCWRQWELTWLFIADKDKMKNLVESKKQVYFWEALWKHSEIEWPIDECDYTFVSDDEKVISIIKEFNLETGYNPFNYIDEE